MEKYFVVLLTVVVLLCMSIGNSHGRKLVVDYNEDFAKYPSFDFDHVEKTTYYDTFEDLIGVNTPLINQTANYEGIWKYESSGPGGCCGGLWELSINGYNNATWTAEDNVELLIRFVSNVPLTLRAGDLDISATVISHDAPKESLIQWTTYTLKIPSPTQTRLTLLANFSFSRIGYMLLDKIVIGINESVLTP